MKRFVSFLTALVLMIAAGVTIHAAIANRISSVTVDSGRKTITVTAQTDQESTALVAFYDETGRMISVYTKLLCRIDYPA